jgi:cytochrome c553
MADGGGRSRQRAVLVAVAGLLALAGCRQDMHNQPRYKAYRESDFFADGSSMRQPVADTVSRGSLREDEVFYKGVGPDGNFVAEPPVQVTADLLRRGRDRFDIFCSPCHGRTGEGNGMIVQRGFKQPNSYHSDRLRNEKIGYFFDVMTNGFGQMSSYAGQVPPADRWAIAAYIRALQLSQHAPVALLSSEDRQGLVSAAAALTAAEHGTTEPTAHE